MKNDNNIEELMKFLANAEGLTVTIKKDIDPEYRVIIEDEDRNGIGYAESIKEAVYNALRDFLSIDSEIYKVYKELEVQFENKERV